MEWVIEHIGLASRDTVALKDWYVSVLGARVVFDNGQTPPAFLVGLGSGTLIEIYSADSSHPKIEDNKLAGWRHLALKVASLEKARGLLEARGVVFDQPIKPAGGGGRVLFFKDGDGNLLHLVERAGESFVR